MKIPKLLPYRVRDVGSADCVYCPHGADVKPGDWVYVHEEKPRTRRRQRLVEVTAVRRFNAGGQAVTLDTSVATPQELMHIAANSEISLEALMQPPYVLPDRRHLPVVVYFRPCDASTDSTAASDAPEWASA